MDFDELVINKIKFGNPPENFTKIIGSITYLDTLYYPLKKFIPYPNFSDNTRQELNEINKEVKLMNDDPEMTELCLMTHKNFNGFWHSVLSVNNITMDQEFINNIIEDVEPLIQKLKFFFNRPRPYQLACYYRLNLFPLVNEITASYPSSSYCKSLLIANIFGRNNKDKAEHLYMQAHNMGAMRIKLGLNYPSDLDFAETLCIKILNHNGFRKKFNL